MFKEEKRINFSEQLVVCATVHLLANKYPSAPFSYTLVPSPRYITPNSMQFLHPAQSTGSLGDVWTSALGPDLAA